MSDIDIRALLEAGAHFGHKTSRWHPKMAEYIHSTNGNNHVIDLTKTVEKLEEALAFLNKVAASGKQILIVGTKRQAKELVEKAAADTSQPHVTVRWMGGMLTNKKTMSGRIKHLKKLEERMASGELDGRFNKLEVQRFQEEIEAMNLVFGGIKDMNSEPGAVVITDVVTDAIVVREANKLKIPIVGIVDTNADPSQISHPIPCNDDAIKALELVLGYMVESINDGRSRVKAAKPEAAPEKKVVRGAVPKPAETRTDKPVAKKLDLQATRSPKKAEAKK